ncbi:hypothetical protein BV154_008465 [Haemophilus influenzae]|uniref:Bacteriophage CII protein n=1 Tax=Haemophilus influenzae TaxID=727 RepID=A0A2S9RQQ5_HAEIF|nr:hypothetical protein [Haemophilus influenzae]PRI47033.1 hypothetical protein BVZ70_00340 [Haemophilus influenzae]PRI89767.1 hypothetical protein BV020_01407 [Haemophilus influenzae]PRI91370.1 hypothetical protein BV021_00174 [Haemophilus influenzae]PRJ63186.1 hypothetical protein BV102_00389 [Haemophilus influenzae]PRJ82258.1 hypothetical protein BV154_01003 [Haemophilus influenzae]
MARNELSKDAIKNADLIRQKAANTKDVHAADYIGVDAATICRFKAEHLDKFCAYLDFLGLTVTDKDLKQISEADLNTLKLFAEKGIKNY